MDLIYGLPQADAGEASRAPSTSCSPCGPDRVARVLLRPRALDQGPAEVHRPRGAPRAARPSCACSASRARSSWRRATSPSAWTTSRSPRTSWRRAVDQRTLHRNFMGYTVKMGADMVGLGVSAIGDVARELRPERQEALAVLRCALEAGRFPIERGYALDEDDMLRREVITRLMCTFHLDIADIERRHRIAFHRYFAQDLAALSAPDGPVAHGLPGDPSRPPGGRGGRTPVRAQRLHGLRPLPARQELARSRPSPARSSALRLRAVAENPVEWAARPPGPAPPPADGHDRGHAALAHRGEREPPGGVRRAGGGAAHRRTRWRPAAAPTPGATAKLLFGLAGARYLREEDGRYALTPMARTLDALLGAEVLARCHPPPRARYRPDGARRDVPAHGRPHGLPRQADAGGVAGLPARAARACPLVGARGGATRPRPFRGEHAPRHRRGARALRGRAAADATPRLRATVLDLPDAVEEGQALAARGEPPTPIAYRAGDARSADLGEGAWDVVFLGNLVHHFDDATNRALMSRIARALAPGGTVTVLEIMRSPSAARRRAGGGPDGLLLRRHQRRRDLVVRGDRRLAGGGGPRPAAAHSPAPRARVRDGGRAQALRSV